MTAMADEQVLLAEADFEAAREEKPEQRDHKDDDEDDEDDEAPESVSKESAKQVAEEQLQRERDAVTAQAAAAKKKRRAQRSKQEAIEEPVAGIEELPADVLSALAARETEEQNDLEEQEALEQERKAKRRRLASKPKQHIREFDQGITVQTLDHVTSRSETRPIAEDAAKFLKLREAPHRERVSKVQGHPAFFTKKKKLAAASIRH